MTLLLHPLLHQVGLEPPDHLANMPVSGISCDSRRLGPGTLFVGMEGTQVDGGRYWRQAIAAGACAAVISEAAAAAEPPAAGDPVLVVPSPVALWAGELAAAFWQHPSLRLKLVGVTGTNGKTTTTHLIEHLSSACGHPSALFGTLVNRWPGTSVTAHHTTAFADVLQTQLSQAVEAGAQIGAMEVSSHALDQQRVAGTRFSGGVFTNLTQDHLDYHPSMEAYFEAKAQLFEQPLLMGVAPGAAAHAVINVDDPWGARLAERLGTRCWRSSLTPGSPAELQMQDLQFEAGGVSGTLISPLGQGSFHSTLVGRFNLMNQLQAVGALLQLGLPLEALLQGLASFRGVPGRMERVHLASEQPLPAVLVDYAHTPDGLENALGACRPFCQGRLICVFGCGGDRDRSKRPQMGAIAARLADQVIVTSDNPRSEDPQQILADVLADIPAGCDVQVDVDRGRAIACAIAAADVDDLVLIAGKGHEDYQILGSTKVHFDDREEAEKALRSRLSQPSAACAD